MGYEPSETLRALGNAVLGEGSLVGHRLEEISERIQQSTAEVASFIGVLEHLQSPREALNSLKENRRIGFVYISVPLFSPTVVLQTVFPEIMPHISSPRTRIFTRSSRSPIAVRSLGSTGSRSGGLGSTWPICTEACWFRSKSRRPGKRRWKRTGASTWPHSSTNCRKFSIDRGSAPKSTCCWGSDPKAQCRDVIEMHGLAINGRINRPDDLSRIRG